MSRVPKDLQTLNDLLIKDLISKIQSGEATAAELNTARQFLKDNDVNFITMSTPNSGAPIFQLSQELPEFEDPPYPTEAEVKEA